MRKASFFLCTLLMLPAASLHAQEDPEARYKTLQDSYTERVQAIVERQRAERRELLNQFIVSLVRAEQRFRDQGKLEAMIHSRELREELLSTLTYPQAQSNAPEEVRQLIDPLLRRREEIREEKQTELDRLNRILLDALESCQRGFTQQGEIEKAIEIRTLRQKLQQAL